MSLTLGDLLAQKGARSPKGRYDLDVLIGVLVQHVDRWLPLDEMRVEQFTRLRKDLRDKSVYPYSFEADMDHNTGMVIVRAAKRVRRPGQVRKHNKASHAIPKWERDVSFFGGSKRKEESMGSMGNVVIPQELVPVDVYLYTHHDGHRLDEIVASALSRNERWNDQEYLTRIIFSEMIRDSVDAETGYGIGAGMVTEGEDQIVTVNTMKQQVTDLAGNTHSFDEFVERYAGRN